MERSTTLIFFCIELKDSYTWNLNMGPKLGIFLGGIAGVVTYY